MRRAIWLVSAALSTVVNIAKSVKTGLENYCDHMTGTYNSPTPDEPGHTLGGYSQQIVVHERYVLRIRHPQEQLAAVAPLLCAGITTYSPLRHWQAGLVRGRHRVWDIWGSLAHADGGACGGIYRNF